MSKTILESFRIFKTNLNITDIKQSKVLTMQRNVRNACQKNLDVKDSFLTGSYSRDTMIAPLEEADIDIVVVLDPKYYHYFDGQNGGQSGLLHLVNRILRETYAKTPDISRNGQAVTIQFSEFLVDVVPAFSRKGGGHLIPNSISQRWISTDTKKHVDIMQDENNKHGGELIPLIKMIKGWNRTINNYFRSFHLEVMVLQILDGFKIADYPSAVSYFFDKGKSYVKQEHTDPAGYGGNVGSYLSTQEKVDDAVSMFETAFDSAIKAVNYAKIGHIEQSINMWRKIFGKCFPAYG